MSTLPPVPTGTVRKFAPVQRAAKLMLDAVGRVVPVGNAVRKLFAVGAVTVRFNTTDETPVAGTPPRPVTCSRRTRPAPRAALGAPLPVRVSRIRVGVNW